MSRWAGRLRIALILLVLVLATYLPVIITGYIDIRRGDDALRHADYVARTIHQLSADDFASAAAYYRSAARKLPWKPELLEQAAGPMSHVNEDEALSLFEKAGQRGVLSAEGWDAYGFQYWSTSRDQQALEIWKTGLERYPSHYQFYSSMHLAYRRLGDYSAEQLSLEKWLDTGEGTAFDHYELGELLMASDPNRARAQLRQAASMDTELADAVQTLDASLALAALEKSPSGRLVILGRGLGLVNDWGLGQYNFQQAVNADPHNAEAWAWLGEALQHNGKDGKAALDKALELDPNSTLVHALRGLYWKRQGKYEAELAEYQKTAQIEPENPEWQVALGEAYALSGDLVSGLAAYQKATSLAPANPVYWRMLASFCADNGVQLTEIGLPAARKAVQLAPDDPQAVDALGWAFAQAGLLYNAEETLNKATSLAPDSALPHLHLAETYLRKGDQSGALGELKLAQQLDPGGATGTLAAQLIRQYFP